MRPALLRKGALPKKRLGGCEGFLTPDDRGAPRGDFTDLTELPFVESDACPTGCARGNHQGAQDRDVSGPVAGGCVGSRRAPQFQLHFKTGYGRCTPEDIEAQTTDEVPLLTEFGLIGVALEEAGMKGCATFPIQQVWEDLLDACGPDITDHAADTHDQGGEEKGDSFHQ